MAAVGKHKGSVLRILLNIPDAIRVIRLYLLTRSCRQAVSLAAMLFLKYRWFFCCRECRQISVLLKSNFSML